MILEISRMSNFFGNRIYFLAICLFLQAAWLYSSGSAKETENVDKPQLVETVVESKGESQSPSVYDFFKFGSPTIQSLDDLSAHLSTAFIGRKIDENPSSNIPPLVLGIAGGSGSGKTTLATAICNKFGLENITLISHDLYYKDLSHLPMSEREKNNFDHPDSLDTALLVEHVKALMEGAEVDIPAYDYATHSRIQQGTHVLATPVIMLEGILLFSEPALVDLMDVKIFVDADDDIRLIRRLQRDTEERGRTLQGVIKQYMATVRPMHKQFVEPSKRNADIIVPEGLNSVALDLLVTKLQSSLNRS